MQRKGQITLFVIIGIALLFTLLLVFYIVARASPRTAIDSTDLTAIRGPIESCMDYVFEDALVHIGKQGGLLFESQKGLHPDIDPLKKRITINNEAVNISYGLKEDAGNFLAPDQGTNSNQNEYPLADVPLTDFVYSTITDPSNPLFNWSDEEADGPFGQFALPRACDPDGPNNASSQTRCGPELFPLPNTRPSIQESLKEFLENNLETCIDEEELALQLGRTVEAVEANVTVTYEEKVTIVELDMPLKFTNEDGTIQLSPFKKRYPVRILSLSKFAHDLLKRSSKDPFFRLNQSTSYSLLPSYDFFAVDVTKNDEYVVSITDPFSNVDGDPWNFQFLVENRAPILDILPYSFSLYTSMNAGTYNPVTLVLNMADPDEDISNLNVTVELLNSPSATLTATLLPAQGDIWRDIKLEPGSGIAINTPYRVNFTVEDSLGAVDWQIVTITFTEP